MKAAKPNLQSPHTIHTTCDLQNLDGWIAREMQYLDNDAGQALVQHVCQHLDDYTAWPERPVLFWPGCARSRGIHVYSQEHQAVARDAGIMLDRRSNGPAIAAFAVGGGRRPQRFGSTNAWTVHHIYSGKFPYVGVRHTLRAALDGNQFTQSAGLVAIHPIADAMCDEYPVVSWLLRAMAFQRFRYDPDHVFSLEAHDRQGFVGEVTQPL